MSTVNWKIISTDPTNATMVVEYNGAQQLNIPMPQLHEDVDAWVQRYAPLSVAQTDVVFHDLQAGHEGSFEAQESVATVSSEATNTVGSWQEEYIRALIYTVLEEIREQTV